MSEFRWLYHYTDQEGHDGIIKDQAIRASTIEGKKHTHYGKGVYLSDLHPSDFKHIGDKACVDWLFNRPSGYSVQKCCYVITLDRAAMLKANITMLETVDRPEFGHVWLVPEETSLDISTFVCFEASGMTELGRRIKADAELIAFRAETKSETQKSKGTMTDVKINPKEGIDSRDGKDVTITTTLEIEGHDASLATPAHGVTAAGNYAYSLRNKGGNLGVYTL